MKVSLITFANLGKKHNLKTTDIAPVIDCILARGELGQIICQINGDFHFSNTKSALPPLLRYGIRMAELFGVRLSRQQTEALFDYFAARKLERADLYIFHGGYFLPKTFEAARRLGGVTLDIAVGAHLRGNTELEREEYEYLHAEELVHPEAELYARSRHVDLFDYVIVMSDFAKESYIQAGFSPNNIFVAYPDIDLERFTPCVQNGTDDGHPFTVLYMAHTTPLKGLKYLLEAWKQLHIRDAELRIVGSLANLPPPFKEECQRLIDEAHAVRVLPQTPHPENYYRDASVLAFPSLTEGFGRVTLEAMACGIPVITTHNARGLVQDGVTGFVVPIRDPGALREKIGYLHAYRNTARRMGREARAVAHRKKPFGSRVVAIYHGIMGVPTTDTYEY